MPMNPAPPPQQNAPQQPAEGGGGEFAKLVSNIFQGLGVMQQVAGKASPEAAQRFAAIQQEFQAAIEELSGGDEGQEMAPKKQEGISTPEAGTAEVEPM